MESTQAGQVNCKSKDFEKSSIFGRFWVRGPGITLQALEHTPPRKPRLNVSPATYFGAQRPAFAGDHIIDTPSQANFNYGMDQRSEPDFPRYDAPAGPYPGMDMPGPTFRQPGQIQVGVPDALQRVLALQLRQKGTLPWP